MSELCGHCRSAVNPGARVCVGCGAIRKTGLTGAEAVIMVLGAFGALSCAGVVVSSVRHAQFGVAFRDAGIAIVIVAIVAWLWKRSQNRVIWTRRE